MSKKGTNSIANKKQTKGQRRDELERKRDERSRRNALKKERKSKEYRENDENFASFSNQLESFGLKIKDIPGDGNCLFRALGDQLDGDHTTHARHRRETVRYMRDHRADFEPFMEDNVSFNKHLEELSKLSTYGGNDSIVAFARNHGVKVVIHQLNEPRWVIQGSECNKHAQVRELHISYHNGEHFSSVRYVGDDGTEPAWMKHNQMTYFGAVELGKSPTSKRKVRNPKEKEKKRGIEITRTTNGETSNISQGTIELTAEELVVTATGCKDMALVRDALEENSYDVDAAINFILQLICVAEETGCTSGEFFNSSSKLPYSETEKCVEMIEPITNKAFTQTSACFGENGELSDSRMWHNTETTTSDIKESTKDADKSISVPESELENRRDVTNRGTRPKVKTNNMQKPSNTHLSNKKRKELAKQEKKQRREGRKKEEVNGVQESSVTVEQSVSGVVADLGVLAI